MHPVLVPSKESKELRRPAAGWNIFGTYLAVPIFEINMK
jgi:hypothetical protein